MDSNREAGNRSKSYLYFLAGLIFQVKCSQQLNAVFVLMM